MGMVIITQSKTVSYLGTCTCVILLLCVCVCVYMGNDWRGKRSAVAQYYIGQNVLNAHRDSGN